MMFGIKNGTGFRGAVDYDIDLNGRHNKEAQILAAEGVDVYFNSKGRLEADPRELARSFRIQATMNPAVKKCVKHLWLSYMPDDQLAMVNNKYIGRQHFVTLSEAIASIGQQRVNDISDKAMVNDAVRLLKELKYDQTQYLIVRHSEKDNPHIHIILNMVDNNGNRLKDFQEKKRGFKICKQITLEKKYTWGAHKSVSATVSNNPKDNARAAICKTIFDISKNCKTAYDLQKEAALRGISVKYLTDFQTGIIKGISFLKAGFPFPASKVDASITAPKLFPSQRQSNIPLSALPPKDQITVKEGGIVMGFNDQVLQCANAPELPLSVKESYVRDEYHKAISQAEKYGSRIAYMQNIAGLAIDTRCGAAEERAYAVAAYIKDEQPNQTVVQRILEIIRIADEQALQKKNLFWRFHDFILNIKKSSMNFKRFPISAGKSDDKLKWSDLRDGTPGDVVRLARSIHEVIEWAYEAANNEKKSQEAAKSQANTQNKAQSLTPRRREESRRESKSKGIKFH